MQGVPQTTWQQTRRDPESYGTDKISRSAFFIRATNRNQRQGLPTIRREGGEGRDLLFLVAYLYIHTILDTYLSRQFRW